MAIVTDKPRVAVFGAGITGLTTANALADAGYAVDIYESSNRLGGKIETTQIGGTTVEAGGEFIDTRQTGLLNLCRKLGVGIIDAVDQRTVKFLDRGDVLSEGAFAREVRPLQEKMLRDKAEIAANPAGERARQLGAMSLAQYLAQLATPEPERKTMWQKFKKTARELWERITRPVARFLPSRRNEADTLQLLAGSFESEAGRGAAGISALQFVGEMSSKPGEFLESDCGYRVAGGTSQIIAALKRELDAKGASFHMNAPVSEVAREGGKLAVTSGGKKAAYDQVALALPAYALGKIEGLESLGFTRDEVALMRDLQYTQNAKFTVRTRRPVASEAMFSSEGYQTWSASPDVLTFLVGGERVRQMKGGELVDDCLNSYAKAHGMKAEELFDKSQIVFRGPGSPACYATPAPGQAEKLAALAGASQRLASQGVVVAGSFLPSDPNRPHSYGFMENAVQSASQGAAMLIASHALAKAKQPSVETPAQKPEPQKPGFAQQVEQKRAQAQQNLVAR